MGIDETIFVNESDIPVSGYCAICLDVSKDAVVTKCDHIFCEACLKEQITANGDCPECRTTLSQHAYTPARIIRVVIGKAPVRCECGWEGRFSLYDSHRERDCLLLTRAEKRSFRQGLRRMESKEIESLNRNDLATMSVKRLLNICRNHGIDTSKMVEKTDIVSAINAKIQAEKNIIPVTHDELNKKSVRELKAICKEKRISTAGVVDKRNIVELILQRLKEEKAAVSASGYNFRLERGGLGSVRAKSSVPPPQPKPPPAPATPPPQSQPNPSGADGRERVRVEVSGSYHGVNQRFAREEVDRPHERQYQDSDRKKRKKCLLQ